MRKKSHSSDFSHYDFSSLLNEEQVRHVTVLNKEYQKKLWEKLNNLISINKKTRFVASLFTKSYCYENEFFTAWAYCFIQQRLETPVHSEPDAFSILNAYQKTMASSFSFSSLHPLQLLYGQILLKYPFEIYNITLTLGAIHASNGRIPTGDRFNLDYIEKINILSDLNMRFIYKPLAFKGAFIVFDQILQQQRQWSRISILISFVRANKNHAFQNSILSLIPHMLTYLEFDDFNQHWKSKNQIVHKPKLPNKKEIEETIIQNKCNLFKSMEVIYSKAPTPELITLMRQVTRNYLQHLDTLYFQHYEPVCEKISSPCLASRCSSHLFLPIGKNYIYIPDPQHNGIFDERVQKIFISLPRNALSFFQLLPLKRYQYMGPENFDSSPKQQPDKDMNSEKINEMAINSFYWRGSIVMKDFELIEEKKEQETENDDSFEPNFT